jgi:hypothetical protein
MENVWRANVLLRPIRGKVRTWVRLLIGVSTLAGFSAFCDMNSYMPLHRQIPKALAMTLEAHLGLWLATLEIKSRWRFLVALLLIPSGVGSYVLFWRKTPFSIVVASVFLSWLLWKVARGESFDTKSVR